jgi:hypothetical protein
MIAGGQPLAERKRRNSTVMCSSQRLTRNSTSSISLMTVPAFRGVGGHPGPVAVMDAVVAELKDRAGRIFLEEAFLPLPACCLSGRVFTSRVQSLVSASVDPKKPLRLGEKITFMNFCIAV